MKWNTRKNYWSSVKRSWRSCVNSTMQTRTSWEKWMNAINFGNSFLPWTKQQMVCPLLSPSFQHVLPVSFYLIIIIICYVVFLAFNKFHSSTLPLMALDNLHCADVPYTHSLTHSLCRRKIMSMWFGATLKREVIALFVLPVCMLNVLDSNCK